MSFSYVEQDHAYPKLKYPKLQHQHQQPRANRHQVVSGLPDHDYHLEHRSGNDDEEVIFLEDNGRRRSMPTPTTASTSKLTTRPKIIYGVPIVRSQTGNPSTSSGSGARDSNQHHRKHHDQDGSGGSDCISDDEDDEEEEEVIFAKRQPIENPSDDPQDDFDLDEPNQLVIDCPPEDTEPEGHQQTETEVVVVDHDDHPHQQTQNGQMATVICLPSGQTVITNIVPIVSITSSTTGADSGIPPANITNNSSASSSSRSPFGSDNDASGSGFDGNSYDDSRDPDDDSEEGPSIDEIRAKRVLDELGIPLSPSDIVNMTIDAFNDVFTKYPMLSNNEAELIRTIRRRGKNKIAAFNCRKRKLDTIQDLAGELTEWRDKQTRLEAQLAALTRIRDLAKAQCNRMQQFVDKHDKFTKYKKVEQTLRKPNETLNP